MTTAPQPTVVSIVEGKVQSLAAFIESQLPQSCNDATTEITLIARTQDSPIAQAVARLNDVIVSRGIRVRALFVVAGPHTDTSAWTSLDNGIEFQRDVRWCSSARYLDAHEQLVLSLTASWIGDCMRRDAAKRDALDLPKAGCLDSSQFASRSFERLWLLGEPLTVSAGRGKRDALAAKLATVQVGLDKCVSEKIDPNQ